jgi:hypothetical protein
MSDKWRRCFYGHWLASASAAVLIAGLFTRALPALDAAETASWSSSSTSAPAHGPPPNDLLQFLDGSSLHGKLSSIVASRGIAWEFPNAKRAIDFRPTNVAWIRFENPAPVANTSKPNCRFRFNNGDEVFGTLSAIDTEGFQLDAWFGGALKAPREALQSITFLSKGYSILYEGPTSGEGWVQGKTPHTWEYRDGAMIATGAGTLGRDFKITKSCSLAFDLGWNGQFSLILALYTPVLDRFDYSSSSYMFYLSPGYITLQRVQGGAGAINLGQAQIPEMGRKSRLHLEIRASKEDNTLSLLVDDRLVQRWKDSSGFVGQGSGVVFFAQLDGPSIRVSNIKVAQWDGELALDSSTNAPSGDDIVYLINRDKVSGQLRHLQQGTLTIAVPETSLDIPLSRVSQICFANARTNSTQAGPWELRAYFAGGGTVAFQLNDWNSKRVAGRSTNFGEVEFDPRSIRQLQFNLGRPKLGTDEMEILDDEVWDLE